MSSSCLMVHACAVFQQAYTFKCLVCRWLSAEGRRFAVGGAADIRKNDYICQILDVRWILLLTLRLLKDLPSTMYC